MADSSSAQSSEDTLLSASIEKTLNSTGRVPVQGEPLASFPLGSARFELGDELGRGGMGRVVSAVDRQFSRVVALKEVLPGVGSARTTEERLKYLPVVVSVAQTLGYAHDRGVVHRDVKPNNVLVGPHGETVLLDWGIAKVNGLKTPGAALAAARAPQAIALGAGTGETMQGAIVGTPSYMAPEQAAGRIGEIDARTDVFQLGALLFHCCRGARHTRAQRRSRCSPTRWRASRRR